MYKPSSLPENTIILFHDHQFVKSGPDSWTQMYADSKESAIVVCDVPERIEFEGALKVPSDEFFDGFRILALPFDVVKNLAIKLNDEYEGTTALNEIMCALVETAK